MLISELEVRIRKNFVKFLFHAKGNLKREMRRVFNYGHNILIRYSLDYIGSRNFHKAEIFSLTPKQILRDSISFYRVSVMKNSFRLQYRLEYQRQYRIRLAPRPDPREVWESIPVREPVTEINIFGIPGSEKEFFVLLVLIYIGMGR